MAKTIFPDVSLAIVLPTSAHAYCAPYVGARFLHSHNCHSYLASSVEPCSTTILDAILISHMPSITLYCTPYVGAHLYTPIALMITIWAWRHWLGIIQPLCVLSSSLTCRLPSTTLLPLCRRIQGGGVYSFQRLGYFRSI